MAVRLDIGFPVAPAAASRAFVELAHRRGARIHEGVSVQIAQRDGRVLGVRRAAGVVEAAGAVVVTAGPWSPEVVDPTGAWRRSCRSGRDRGAGARGPAAARAGRGGHRRRHRARRRAGRRRGRGDRVQPRDGRGPLVRWGRRSSRSSRIRASTSRASAPAARATCRRSQARRRAGCGRAPGRWRSTVAPSSVRSPASNACSSPPATDRGGSRPAGVGAPRRGARPGRGGPPDARGRRRHRFRAVRRPARLRR